MADNSLFGGGAALAEDENHEHGVKASQFSRKWNFIIWKDPLHPNGVAQTLNLRMGRIEHTYIAWLACLGHDPASDSKRAHESVLRLNIHTYPRIISQR